MSRRLDDEELLEWVLDPRPGDDAPRLELGDDKETGERLAELQDFVSMARSVSSSHVAPGGEGSDSRLAGLRDSILRRTTREDLSWRGDLSLYGRFLRGRLARSGWLQLVAASLLAHMIALPALAIYVLVTTPAPPEIGFIPWEDYYPAGFPEEAPDEPVPPLEVPDQGDDLQGLPPSEAAGGR